MRSSLDEARAKLDQDREPLRILFVDYSIGFGGATKSMALTLREVPDVEPFVLTSQTPEIREYWYGAWPTYSFRRLINYRTTWKVREFLERRRVPSPLRWLVLKALAGVDTLVSIMHTARIVWLCKRKRIQVVHLVTGLGPPEALAGARLAKVPTVVHMRSFYQHSGRIPDKYMPAMVVGCSNAVRDTFLERTGAKIRAATIPDVIQSSLFPDDPQVREQQRARWNIKPDDIVVGIFGRVIEWKGQREFVQAMLLAMDEDPRLIGMIVGDASDGTRAYFDEVKALIRESRHASRFVLTGYITEVEAVYSAVDIVVHSSIEPEPNGMVVQEGMAAGRPVIAADAGGPLELIEHGTHGYLIDPMDFRAVSNAIVELARDPALRCRLGAAARQRALERYDIPVAARQLRAAYDLLGPDAKVRPIAAVTAAL